VVAAPVAGTDAVPIAGVGAVDFADRVAGFVVAAPATTAARAAAAAVLAGTGVPPAWGNLTVPATTSLKYLPGRNAGTFVLFTFTASPVRGLRAERDARDRFSNTPKPEIDTFRPFCTSRWTKSMKPSTAIRA
jgi:hypothetical protein